jgi:tetratricopeptide (TPR) repeat protein
MNKDNVLFGLCGLLAGFIAGYIVAQQTGGAVRPSAASPAPAAAVSSADPGTTISTSPEMRQRASEIEAAMARDPGNPELAVALGNVYYDMNDWSRASGVYEKAVSAKGADPNFLTDLGSCYRNLGQFERALDYYQRAQKADPKHEASLLNETLIYAFDLSDPIHAQPLFDRLKAEHPEIPRLQDLQTRISQLRAARS